MESIPSLGKTVESLLNMRRRERGEVQLIKMRGERN